MITKTVKRLYQVERKKGVRAETALVLAKQRAFIEHNWADYEEAELVRLRFEPDDMCLYDDLAGDCYDPEHADTVPGGLRTIEAQEKAFKNLIERDGVWGYIIEVRCPKCGQWEHFDSCWGFVGEVYPDAYLWAQAEAIKQVIDA